MSNYISFNGKILPAGAQLVTAANRGLRYGDGLFETMRVVSNRIVLASLHFDRLFHGLNTLRFQCPAHFTSAYLEQEILKLCRKMKVADSARVRLNIIRGNGGLFDPESHAPNLIIEAWPLDLPKQINENGLVVDIYEAAQKPCDSLANIKSNNYLPYALAALYAKDKKLNDCFLLNTRGRICDSTIANVFWVKEGLLFTPPLSEGGVAGVMRRYLMEAGAKGASPVREELLTPETLSQADEIFLTNAIQGVKWVSGYRGISYTNKIAAVLFGQITKDLWGT